MNSIGQIFRLTDFGETHGKCVGGIIDGCPAGLHIDYDFIRKELSRRAPNGASGVTGRKESDSVRFLSGIYQDVSTGAPIAFVIENEDGKVNEETNGILKPSHSSFVLKEKYGHICNEQGGRFSARQTVCRVVTGAVAKLALRQWGISIEAHTETIAEAVSAGDTLGAVVSCEIRNVPSGIGAPAYDGVDARLAAAMLSIPACKGFDIGEGFRAAEMRGSAYNDKQKEGFAFTSNHDGGVQAGISNGQTIQFRAAFKPIPTLQCEQETIDFNGNPAKYRGSCRNDTSVVPRVLPVVEAMAAITILDLLLLRRCDNLSSGCDGLQ